MIEKYNEVTMDFLKNMDISNFKELSEEEDKSMKKDVLQRKYKKIYYAMIAFVCILSVLNMTASLDELSQYIITIVVVTVFLSSVVILGYFYASFVEMKMSQEKLKTLKAIHLDNVKNSFFLIKEDREAIFQNLEKFKIYSENEVMDLRKLIIDGKLGEHHLKQLDLRLRTEKLKMNVLPSTTESIEEQRKESQNV
jgi:hypothetical protein